MLMQLMQMDHSDYKRILRRRRLLSLGLLFLGMVGFVCYFALVRGSATLPDFASGFYLGAACGCTAGSLILLVRVQYLLTHPEAQKKAHIQERDEREQEITKKAFLYAGLIMLYLCVAAMFVLVAIDRTASLVVFFAIVVYCLAWLAVRLYLSKKM